MWHGAGKICFIIKIANPTPLIHSFKWEIIQSIRLKIKTKLQIILKKKIFEKNQTNCLPRFIKIYQNLLPAETDIKHYYDKCFKFNEVF